MPIDTRIDGNPESIRASAQWLKNRLATSMDHCVTDLRCARDEAVRGWQGTAGPAFQSRMEGTSRRADGLRIDIEAAANSFNAYADDLRTSQQGMERARQIARDEGLQLTGQTILEPGPAPVVQALPSDRNPSAEEVRTYNSGVVALDAHYRKVQAYNLAAVEANRARGVIDAAKAIGKNIWDDLTGKSLLVASEVVNGAVVGGLAAAHTSILKKQAEALREESKRAVERYLKAPGGSAEAKALNAQAYGKHLEADRFAGKADSVGRRVGSKIPIVGVAITGAGIGYDIHQGKPAGKAIISGVGGALAAAGAGAAVGTMVGGPVGTVVGAVVGVGVGLVASGALDWGYDQLPQGVRDGIDDGFKEVGDAVGDAGEAVGDTAKKVWNSIF
ncbi:hypothetical protein ACLQ28_22445 [Micromonospora sp. DT201]|uniref:hypothetical protein n=1 Tax=Micromonospora sp. DT201 TaxID=3393442 RepID=UPI003CEB9026